MLKDRGTIKWTAMMLPEHVEMIKEFAKDYYKQPKPELDEQQIQEYERIISEAIRLNQSVGIEYWKDGFFQTAEGKIDHVDLITKQLRVTNEDVQIYIPVDCLVSINIV